jgi:uncharacterized protein (DUF362 family)
MNCTVGCYACTGYEVEKILPLLEEIYRQTQGPELSGKTVLVKPNILQDEATSKAVTTHPVFFGGRHSVFAKPAGGEDLCGGLAWFSCAFVYTA